MLMRLFLGKSRMTEALVFASTLWFTVLVLLAPYSPSMRQDIENMGSLFH